MKKTYFFSLLFYLAIFSFNSCNLEQGESKSELGNKEETAIEASYVKDHFDKQEVTIQMRDGIKLHTSIYSPKDTSKKISHTVKTYALQ